MQELAKRVPIAFVGAQGLDVYSLLYSEISYEEIMRDFGLQEYTQVLFYFSDGEDCPFRTDGFAYENQKELSQAIQFMCDKDSYSEWERAYYEY